MSLFGHSTHPASPGSIFAATRNFCETNTHSSAPPVGARSTRQTWRHLPDVGAFDFVRPNQAKNPGSVLWSPGTLPSVVALTRLPADLADPKFRLPPISAEHGAVAEGAERLIELNGAIFRIHVDTDGAEPPAVLLPLDRLFEIRAAAAIRLWRGLVGRDPGPGLGVLSKARTDRLILALRALDGRLAGASYRTIAGGLFDMSNLSASDWKNHDLRDRTIRLVRLGLDMMHGEYRRLLIYPYRRR
jgi:hypothetical protein